MFSETLSEDARKSLALLGRGVLPKNSYMAGGSALALMLGHRISIDFDFFTDIEFSSEELALQLSKIGKFEVSEIAHDTLLGAFNDIKFSLFHYKYPLVFPTNDFWGVRIADKRDISAMKIAAVMDRGTKKDFIDLYFLVKEGISLEKCFEYYEQKYGALANNIYSIITSLSYFNDAETSEMPKMIKMIKWEEVRKFFETEAVRLGRKYLK